MARLHPVEVAAPCCEHDLLHAPRHSDGGRHSPLPHPRSARGGEDQEVTIVVAGQDGAEEWQREQSRTPGRRWLRLEALSKLLHDKVVPDLQEGGEGPLPGDPRSEVGERSLSPRRTLRTKIRSSTGQPRSPRESAMPFIWRQNSLTERSPWTKVRKFASSRSARASALPRNWPLSASQAPRALKVLRTRSWRSREIVPRIQERTMLSRRSHAGV